MKVKHRETVAALRRRNQALQERNAQMRRQMEKFRDREKIVELAQMICVLQSKPWWVAIEAAEEIMKQSEEYCAGEKAPPTDAKE